MKVRWLKSALMCMCCCLCNMAFAWGDQGHRIIALVADHDLLPQVRSKIQALLATDISGLTAITLADEATWAD